MDPPINPTIRPNAITRVTMPKQGVYEIGYAAMKVIVFTMTRKWLVIVEWSIASGLPC